MYNKYKIPIKKGLFSGLIFTLIINICIIMLFYKSSVIILNYLYYLTGPMLSIIIYFYFRNDLLKFFLISILCGAILYLVLEMLILFLGLDHVIYKLLYVRFSKGLSDVDGLIVIYTHIYNLFWIVIGVVVSFITICIKSLLHKL